MIKLKHTNLYELLGKMLKQLCDEEQNKKITASIAHTAANLLKNTAPSNLSINVEYEETPLILGTNRILKINGISDEGSVILHLAADNDGKLNPMATHAGNIDLLKAIYHTRRAKELESKKNQILNILKLHELPSSPPPPIRT